MHYGVLLPWSDGSQAIGCYENFLPFEPSDGFKTTPKSIRKGRSEASADWTSVLRSFNPGTIGERTTPSFWLSLMISLTTFPPYECELVGDVTDYNDDKPERFYSSDLRILHGVSTLRSCYQDIGYDSRTVYLRALLMQGICTASQNGMLDQPVKEVVEDTGSEADGDTTHVAEQPDE